MKRLRKKRNKAGPARFVFTVFTGIVLVGCAHPRAGIRADLPPGTSSEVKRQIGLLLSVDAQKRVRAASVLGSMGADAAAAVPFLMEMLDDNTPVKTDSGESTLRKEAVAALVGIGEPSLDPLTETLEDEDAGLRKTAAWALARLKHPGSVENLIGALGDEDRGVKRWSSWALYKITRMNFGYDAEKWREWWKTNKERVLREYSGAKAETK